MLLHDRFEFHTVFTASFMITVRFREDDSFHVLFSMHLSGHELHILVHSQYHFISQMVSMLSCTDV